jgi:hypothetical protein
VVGIDSNQVGPNEGESYVASDAVYLLPEISSQSPWKSSLEPGMIPVCVYAELAVKAAEPGPPAQTIVIKDLTPEINKV